MGLNRLLALLIELELRSVLLTRLPLSFLSHVLNALERGRLAVYA
jgi:hypothetical protein